LNIAAIAATDTNINQKKISASHKIEITPIATVEARHSNNKNKIDRRDLFKKQEFISTVEPAAKRWLGWLVLCFIFTFENMLGLTKLYG